ncbi:MAG: FHA domain-containing protein [Methylacidiphilales bacterium]|nr:FHA domain-containing protein [Candidatus Methylacidiphilales bacterium]
MAEVKNICLEALERRCSSGETGRLDLRRGPHEGQIFTKEHFLIHAQLAGLEGIPALFRMFDWGDAETTWQSGVMPERASLHLTMSAASVLYAEHLQEKAELETREKERLEQAFGTPEFMAGQVGGIESVLKYYTISLECADPEILPGGFTFVDANKSSYVIGSSDECDVILRNPSVDPLHCGLILEKGSVTIWDLGAQSGVKLNGFPVAQDTLKVGDVMTLGSLDLHVRFQLRRPTINRPKPVAPAPGATPATTMPMPKLGPPPKELPKGAIAFDRISGKLKDTGKAKPFLAKLGSLFGGGSKDRHKPRK